MSSPGMSVPVGAVLAFAAWTLMVLLLGVGIQRWTLIFAGRAELKDFPADAPHGSPFYRRTMRAHANCVENLPIFIAVVFAAEASSVRSTSLDVLSSIVVAARVLQTVCHFASGSNTAIAFRFAFFAVQIAAVIWMGALVALLAN